MNATIVGGTVALALVVAGCSSEPSGPSTRTLSPSERQALAATLLSAPQMATYGPIAAAALVYVNEVGQLSVRTDTSTATYSAVALSMDINAVHGIDTVISQFFTVLAWQGTGATITRLSLVIGAGNTAPKSDSLSQTFNGSTGGTALFGDAPYGADDVYVSSAGTLSVTSLSFTGSTSYTQGTTTGSYSAGTLGGTFTVQGANAALQTRHQSADFTAGLPAVHLIVRGSF